MLESGKQSMETFTGFGEDETEDKTHRFIEPTTPAPSQADLDAEAARQVDIETF